MSKKNGPAPPPPPDPAATAAAQEKTNVGSAIAQANLNRINQVTPQGSLSYTQDTNADGTPKVNPDGTPVYTQTQTLSPDEQKKYDLNNQVAISLDGLAGNNIGRVADAQSTPFTYDGMTPIVSSVQSGPLNNGPTSGQLNNGPAGGGATGVSGAGNGVQNSLDYSKLTALPGTSDFSGDAAKTQASVYAQAASRLDPQWSNNDNDLSAKLAAQGISENSDAYRRAQTQESQNKNDAYNQAGYSAIQAGSAEQSRLFGLAMNARQQGQNEVDTQGNFRNSAQGQVFDQSATQADQSMRANDQNFTQQEAAARLANENEQTRFSQDTSAAAMANTNQNTKFNQDSANATLADSARQQQIQQAAYLRNMPINDIAALLGTGPGVQQPDFNPVSQVGVAAPDYQGIVQNNYAQAMGQYNNQQQANAQMWGSIFGAAGTAGAAAIKMSDKRFKGNIRRIGTLANGLATYAFNYIGDKAQQFGVMAQEVLKVIPGAVSYGPDGYMRVDYGKVY